MFIWVLTTSIALCLLYWFYWQPKQMHQHYVQAFKKAGYRVLEMPYRPLGISALKFLDTRKEARDVLWRAKETLPQYDVAVLNVFRDIEVSLYHPDLIQ